METEAEKALKNRILKRIRQEINNSFGHYFSYAWREAIGEMLEQESKYSKLVDWIDREIKDKMTTANCFSFSDMITENDCKNTFFETFREQLSDIAMLTYFREVLLDDRTTTKMRENIEYSIGKVFGVHYDEYLKDYV